MTRRQRIALARRSVRIIGVRVVTINLTPLGPEVAAYCRRKAWGALVA
jgi:hypothetical protein